MFGVIVPWRGWARMQRLQALLTVSGRDRLRLYATSIASQWILAGFIAWRALARGVSLSELGLKFTPLGELIAAGLVGSAFLGLVHWANLARVARSKNPAHEPIRKVAAAIFPHTDREAAIFCGLALTAGVCEEFLYRGFVFAALSRLLLPTWTVLFISSILFGLAHAYQGRKGMVGTLLLGTVFGCFRILYDSLVPVVFWHTAVDLVAGFAGRRYLIENR